MDMPAHKYYTWLVYVTSSCSLYMGLYDMTLEANYERVR